MSIIEGQKGWRRLFLSRYFSGELTSTETFSISQGSVGKLAFSAERRETAKAFGVERTCVNGIPIVGDLNVGYGGSG